MTEITGFEKKMYGEYLIEVTYEFEGQSCIKFDNGIINVVRSSELDNITHTINNKDIELLNWIYASLRCVHMEPKSLDYMVEFDAILKRIKQ